MGIYPNFAQWHYYNFKLSQNIHFATDFKVNSMASRMNSGGSNDLNCVKIDPRTGKKFSFNVDIGCFIFFTSDQKTALIDRKLMAYTYYDFKLSQNIHSATDLKENSMASRMNSGSSNDLNCIKTDPR